MIDVNRDLWTYLKEQTSLGRPVVLYGTGNGADKIIKQLELRGIMISGVFASPGFVRSRDFAGFKVTSFEEALSSFGSDMIILMCFGSSRPEVLEYVRYLRSKCEFYAPDVPVYGTNLFDLAFYRENLESIDKVRSLLEDPLSVKTFDDTILYKLTGDVSYLEDCEVSQAEADGVLDFKAIHGAYIDLGAYNGDTLKQYTSLFPGITETVAVEPDPASFRKLKRNTAGIASEIKTTYVNAMIYEKSGTAFTDKNAGRGVHIKSAGDTEVATCTIDELCSGKSPAFIKFDVEGAEAAALRGGEETIKKFTPAMCVACYHRSEDIFALALQVKDINPRYRIYLRHTPSVPCWDTSFYFVPDASSF